jgi:hypothetical protein
MPNIELQLPAGVGDVVLVHGGEHAGQVAMVVAWRVVRPRFLLGGALDPAPQLSLQVITAQGDNRWLWASEVMGLSAPVVMILFLPFTDGDEVVVHPSRSLGEIRGWEVTGRRLETVVVYRVHLHGTPAEDEVEVDAVFLEPRLPTPRAGTR